MMLSWCLGKYHTGGTCVTANNCVSMLLTYLRVKALLRTEDQLSVSCDVLTWVKHADDVLIALVNHVDGTCVTANNSINYGFLSCVKHVDDTLTRCLGDPCRWRLCCSQQLHQRAADSPGGGSIVMRREPAAIRFHAGLLQPPLQQALSPGLLQPCAQGRLACVLPWWVWGWVHTDRLIDWSVAFMQPHCQLLTDW